MSLKQLKNRLRPHLLRRLFGWNYVQRLDNDHITISRTGNRGYLEQHPELIAPEHQAGLNAYEFSYYSQNGEDGLILYLLSKIGVISHFIVEIGIEDGRECNSANLLLNFGWRGCLIEASPEWAEKAGQYFREQKAYGRIVLLNQMAKPGNIEAELKQAEVPTEIDVLSIDIDSYDYWLWSAINSFKPRLVVIEYNASFGPEKSVTVPYSPHWSPLSRYYHGASITALAKLGRKKGYVLVGCDSKGVNAFFVREDLAVNAGIETVAPEFAYKPHFRRTQKLSVEKQQQAIADLPLEEVE